MNVSLLAKTQAAVWHLLGQISQLSKALKASESCGKARYWDAQVTVPSVSEQKTSTQSLGLERNSLCGWPALTSPQKHLVLATKAERITDQMEYRV